MVIRDVDFEDSSDQTSIPDCCRRDVDKDSIFLSWNGVSLIEDIELASTTENSCIGADTDGALFTTSCLKVNQLCSSGAKLSLEQQYTASPFEVQSSISSFTPSDAVKQYQMQDSNLQAVISPKESEDQESAGQDTIHAHTGRDLHDAVLLHDLTKVCLQAKRLQADSNCRAKNNDSDVLQLQELVKRGCNVNERAGLVRLASFGRVLAVACVSPPISPLL